MSHIWPSRVPRRMGPILWFVFGSAFYIALPWAVSRIGPRHGWQAEMPGVANLAGLVLIAAGVSILAWALVLHYRSALEGWPLRFRPSYLLTCGPYRLTRNPMYLGGLALWLGWAALYGSLAVLVAFLAFAAFLSAIQVPWEERICEEEFGDAYRRYRAEVPRWLLLFLRVPHSR